MALYKIKDFDPDYRQHFDDKDILGFDLYSGDEKVGSVDNLLVDEAGNFRYFVINTGIWVFGKKVLLPIGRARISHSDRRVYADGLTQSQVENLPNYDENMTLDYDHEEQVRGVYRPTATTPGTATVDRSTTLGSTSLDRSTTTPGNAPVDRSTGTPAAGRAAYDRNSYSYDRDPDLYNINEQNHQNLKLYEERLIANKTRQKTGEVTVGKHVETETQRVSVPVEKERVVVERTTPTGAGTAVNPGDASFREGEVARMDVYEETPDIHKEAFVREEVKVRKEVDRDTVNAEEQLRREELDVNTEGRPNVDRGINQRSGTDRRTDQRPGNRDRI
ncbi:DUF2382 domain-containing protein [Oculatella sp. LEGE 06141]|uniref:DUF2382 domain-containing protein n=1 Tax=Oculatella sp. LEGE 06141 TaxID=1828648 RepID=UPI0018823F84|nr:DUF2382 domain-containing protein [Oculatella sp. LEGE 06141]MBE9181570.1 DUF2382 domain-containing protein [Oculatella sp. LEGE 06141]